MHLKTELRGIQRVSFAVANVRSIYPSGPWANIIHQYCQRLQASSDRSELERLYTIMLTTPSSKVSEVDYILNAMLLRALHIIIGHGISLTAVIPADKPEMIRLAEALLRSPATGLNTIPMGRGEAEAISTLSGFKPDNTVWGARTGDESFRRTSPDTKVPVQAQKPKKEETMKKEPFLRWKDILMDRSKHRLALGSSRRVQDVHRPKDQVLERVVKRISSGEVAKFPSPDEFKVFVYYGGHTGSSPAYGLCVQDVGDSRSSDGMLAKLFLECKDINSLLTKLKECILFTPSVTYAADKMLDDMTAFVNSIIKYILQSDISITDIMEDWGELGDYLGRREMRYLNTALRGYFDWLTDDEKNSVGEARRKEVYDVVNGLLEEPAVSGYIKVIPFIYAPINDEDAGTILIYDNEYMVLSSLYHKNLIDLLIKVMDMSGQNWCELSTNCSKYLIFKSPVGAELGQSFLARRL